MTGPELEAAIARYFFADDLDAAERARLVSAGLAFVAEPPRRIGQVGQFAPASLIGHGLAWWEERQHGSPELRLPISELDHALMMLTSEPRLDPRPAPRPHCPPDLRGRWECAGVSRDDVAVEPPRAARAWTLGDGGALATEGDPGRTGWTWRVHEGRFRILHLGPPRDPRRERWTVLAIRPTAAELDLLAPGAVRGFERWRRG